MPKLSLKIVEDCFYIARLYAYKGESIQNLFTLYVEGINKGDGAPGGIGGSDESESEDPYEGIDYLDVEDMVIRHEVNEISTCEGVLRVPPKNPKGAVSAYSFASLLFEAMNSNFQRNVYLEISYSNVFQGSETSEKGVVFSGVLETMRTGRYGSGGDAEEVIRFTAKGSIWLEARAKKTFVPSYENLNLMLGAQCPTKGGPAQYSLDDNWKVDFSLEEKNDCVKLVYRPNMVVHNRSFYDYCLSLAKMNGCLLFVNDITRKVSFINTEMVPAASPLSEEIGCSFALARLSFDDCRAYGEADAYGEDYSLPSTAFDPNAKKEDSGGSQKDGADSKGEGKKDSAEEVKDENMGFGAANLADDDFSALSSKAVLNAYFPFYEFRKDENDKRESAADNGALAKLAKRLVGINALSRLTAVLKYDFMVKDAACKMMPGNVVKVEAGTGLPAGDYIVTGVEHRQKQRNGKVGTKGIRVTVQKIPDKANEGKKAADSKNAASKG